jgi:hypothetical protein
VIAASLQILEAHLVVAQGWREEFLLLLVI